MLKMITPDQALDLVLVNTVRRPSSETLLGEAHGRILAQNVRADRDFPPFPRAMMDGYAVCVADAGSAVEVVGEVAAGQTPTVEVGPGRCVNIMTGAACPTGAEAVVPVEKTRIDGQRVVLPEGLIKGKHIAPKGTECPAGSMVLAAGYPLSSLTVGVLAAVGRERLQTIDLPRVAIISTGSELCPPGQTPGPFQIRNSNGPMLAAQVQLGGMPTPEVLHAKDTPESLAQALDRAADSDIVLLSGGVSMGRYDLVPAALKERKVNAIFHKVSQKPGKPLLFGRREDQLFFGLPGNPLSSHFCYHRYVAPAARKMAGRSPLEPVQPATLTRILEARTSRTLFVLGKARLREGQLEVQPLAGKGSADLFSGQLANGYIRLEPGENRLEPGEQVRFQYMRFRG